MIGMKGNRIFRSARGATHIEIEHDRKRNQSLCLVITSDGRMAAYPVSSITLAKMDARTVNLPEVIRNAFDRLSVKRILFPEANTKQDRQERSYAS